jgi:hypothetical protein
LNFWVNLLFGSVAAVGFGMTCATLFHLRWARRLPRWESRQGLQPLAPPYEHAAANSCSDDVSGFKPKQPSSGAVAQTTSAGKAAGTRVSVVLAARDEEARIEQTVRRLLAQQHVALELIAVDDRSRDRTGEILQRLALEDTRLRVLRVEALPEGWLGKCHACHRGASVATGDWILFTDADCWLKPDVIARALRVAQREGVEHITLTPGIGRASASVFAQAWHLSVLLSLADWFSRVNRDRPKAYLGMGAFNLVRAEAYRACGGYAALRLTVVDDVKLGLLLRRAGLRTRGFIGGDDTECHWGTTARDMIRVMEKNSFALVDYRLTLALGAVLAGGTFWCASVLGPLTGSGAGLAAGLGLLAQSVPASVVAARLGWSSAVALLAPFIFPLMLYAMFKSTLLTLRYGGVQWRDTFYPLRLLREGNVQ